MIEESRVVSFAWSIDNDDYFGKGSCLRRLFYEGYAYNPLPGVLMYVRSCDEAYKVCKTIYFTAIICSTSFGNEYGYNILELNLNEFYE